MRMMPRTAPCQYALRMWIGCHVELRCQELELKNDYGLQLNCMSMKSEHNLYLTLHNVLSSFKLSLVLILPSYLLLYIDFVAFSFSMPPSATFSTRLCKTRTLRKTSRIVLPFLDCCSSLSSGQAQYKCIRYPRELVHVTHEFITSLRTREH